MSPEMRERLIRLFERMSPEQREQLLRRLEERGREGFEGRPGRERDGKPRDGEKPAPPVDEVDVPPAE
jgi:hypothetical protein